MLIKGVLLIIFHFFLITVLASKLLGFPLLQWLLIVRKTIIWSLFVLVRKIGSNTKRKKKSSIDTRRRSLGHDMAKLCSIIQLMFMAQVISTWMKTYDGMSENTRATWHDHNLQFRLILLIISLFQPPTQLPLLSTSTFINIPTQTAFVPKPNQRQKNLIEWRRRLKRWWQSR